MPRDLQFYLWDMHHAGRAILDFTRGKTLDQYLSDELLRAAVERKFEIIGEALSQACQLYPEVRDVLQDDGLIIAFRNRVVHGYFSVDNSLVWSTMKVYLPPLMVELERILKPQSS